MQRLIQNSIKTHLELVQAIQTDFSLCQEIERVAAAMISSLEAGGKILFCGNGGSAADAQHLAAELSGRFYLDRPPLFAEALHVNTSFVTAMANDYDYSKVFARAVQAMGREGDILVAISTSGNSPNILEAIRQAKSQEMKVVGMSGKTGGKMADLVDFKLFVPSEETPRIQEAHILVGHIYCQEVERRMFA